MKGLPGGVPRRPVVLTSLLRGRRSCLSTEPVQGDLVRVHAGRAGVHPGEWHARQGGRQPALRLDQRVSQRGVQVTALVSHREHDALQQAWPQAVP